jgi:exodeoxyribonuclease VII large subunit
MRFADQQVYTVSEINSLVRGLVEEHYPDVAVTGEVSNFKHHTSGHLYFSIKDAGASLRSVCFRSAAREIDIDLRDGMQVVVRGRLTVYEGYGSYQIVAYAIEEAGEGELEKAFRKLVARLDEEGLFDEEHKKTIPRYPERVAVVTSPTGAAIRDILSTIRRRWPCVEVVIAPVRVQGDLAAPEIAAAIEMLSRSRDVDTIILGRGGGSLEDLWAFNEESVARAIYSCPVPIISAVGHETDVTVSDFVADHRAATPSMAAEVAVPRREDVGERVDQLARRIVRHVSATVEIRRGRLDELLRSYALGQVRGRIEASMQRLDYAFERLARSVSALVKDRNSKLERCMSMLSALNPSDILARGYTVCADRAGRLLRTSREATEAGSIRVTFHDGAVSAEVKEAP